MIEKYQARFKALKAFSFFQLSLRFRNQVRTLNLQFKNFLPKLHKAFESFSFFDNFQLCSHYKNLQNCEWKSFQLKLLIFFVSFQLSSYLKSFFKLQNCNSKNLVQIKLHKCRSEFALNVEDAFKQFVFMLKRGLSVDEKCNTENPSSKNPSTNKCLNRKVQ